MPRYSDNYQCKGCGAEVQNLEAPWSEQCHICDAERLMTMTHQLTRGRQAAQNSS